MTAVSASSKCRIENRVAHCYHTFGDNKQFEAAADSCLSRDEHLATISNQLEYNFVVLRMETGT